MATFHCNCPDPQHCSCNQHAPPPQSAPAYYPSMYPTVGLHPWSYPLRSSVHSAPNFYSNPPTASSSSSQTPYQPVTFEDIFQASYSSGWSGTHQGALASDSRFNTVNTSSPISQPTPPSAPSTKRKRATNGSANSSKRRNVTVISDTNMDRELENRPVLPQQAVPGVGPQVTMPDIGTSAQHPGLARTGTTHSSRCLGSLLNPATSESSSADATDVWYFMRALTVQEMPATLPAVDKISKKRPDAKKFPFLGCRLCTGTSWTTWKNTWGQTNTIRQHLKSKHRQIWQDIVVVEHLKGWQTYEQAVRPEAVDREPFSLFGFYDRLLRWICVDDQSIDVVDCPELRELLLYMNEDLRDEDLPHRSKFSGLITDAFKREYNSMIGDIKNSLGRVSFTSDIWSRQNMSSFMAVTAHYSAKDARSGNLMIRSQLVAFRELEGIHSGSNIGKVFLKVVDEINCLHKMSMITLDNASNNQKMMSELEIELQKIGIPFDKDGNRIRCFPHVINIAVKAGLKALTQTSQIFNGIDTAYDAYDTRFMHGATDPSFDFEFLPDLPLELTTNPEYLEALERDIIGSIRHYVTATRASGQRRKQFEQILKEGNEAGGWGDPKVLLRNVGLLKDMDVRWSATFNMLDRFLETYLVSKKLISLNRDLSQYVFTDLEIKIASDIREFLYVFHVVQELVSAEKTPTLSIVLPVYEKCILMLKALRHKLPELAHGIDASITKLEEYLNISRSNKVYGLAMVINPMIKFQWLKDNWSPDDYATARTSVINVMTDYQKESAKGATSIIPRAPITPARRIVKAGSASSAALAQGSGLARFNSLACSLSSPSVLLPTPTNSDGPGAPHSESAEELQRRLDEEARTVVSAEVLKYEAAGIIDGAQETDNFDLLRFWQANQFEYPLLYKIALDILPIQASAVPCERVFSSSKQTDTDRRSNLSSFKMEELQILKYIYRNDRLSFTDNLVCSEHELSVLDISPSTVRDLIGQGQIEELKRYIDESWAGWGKEKSQTES